ncbi:MAG: hypothetical protein M0Q91_05120 [Methanoregula sp.]|jgi:hypothetical protein|nr:hypothetical protein [Methanoregula sp.]
MIITRKAAIGFILLAIIVFGTTQYTITNMHGPPSADSGYSRYTSSGDPNVLKHEPSSYMRYQPPVISLGNNAPLIVTMVIEIFTLGCYLVLKKYEPLINEAATEIVKYYKQ